MDLSLERSGRKNGKLLLCVCFGSFGRREIEGSFDSVEHSYQEHKTSFICNFSGV